MSNKRVLVVGTTPDYIVYIRDSFPDRAVFLIDQKHHEKMSESGIDSNHEIILPLNDKSEILKVLRRHLKSLNLQLSGITCYDCEWLSLTAELAIDLELPYVSPDAVWLCRNKFLSKQTWLAKGIRCPRMQMINAETQLVSLFDHFDGSIVIKPYLGSGSELTFHCHDKYELMPIYRAINIGLTVRNENRQNLPESIKYTQVIPEDTILAEEFISGREYSADFIIDGGKVRIVRVARKIFDTTLPFGTTLAYVVPGNLPGWMSRENLAEKIYAAASTLGLNHALCMVDFVISKDEVVFLELTPRIGGDCLPPLILKSCGINTIGLSLDFAEGRNYESVLSANCTEHAGLRLFAPKAGVLSKINYESLKADPRVLDIQLTREPGFVVTMPPDDYESWLLGYLIFRPQENLSLLTQCRDLIEKAKITMEPTDEKRFSQSRKESGRNPQTADAAS